MRQTRQFVFFFQAEDGIRDRSPSRGLGDVYKRQGNINGNSSAAEIYAESAQINGEVKSKGSVKIGQSSVVIGNIFATSAVIAGAVKGDIDVHGPVILDTSAIVMGNIKSKSVQINNGAVSYTHLRAHETDSYLVCRLLLEKKK